MFDAFWSNADEDENGCLIWRGAKTTAGYGLVVSWGLTGKVPEFTHDTTSPYPAVVLASPLN